MVVATIRLANEKFMKQLNATEKSISSQLRSFRSFLEDKTIYVDSSATGNYCTYQL